MRDDLEFASEWVRAFATTYMPSEAAFSYSATSMREQGISVLDLLSLFRSASVTHVDMNDGADGQKAIWTVVGYDSDETPMHAVLCVETEAISVRVVCAERVISAKRARNGA